MSLRSSHVPLVLMLSFFFGTNLVVSRFAISQIHPLAYAAIRIPFATMLALLWTVLRHGRLPRGRALWIHGSVVGIFATAVPMIFFISALQYQSSGVTALFITLTPVAAMIFGHFLLEDERLTPRRLVGAAVSFGGAGLLLVTGETGLAEVRWEGFVLVLIGVLGQGFGIVHLRKYLHSENSLDITSVRLAVATLVMVPLAWIAVGFDFSRLEWSGAIALVYGGVAGTFLGFLLYSNVVARFGPAKATQTEFLVPIVTVVAGVIFLNERFTVNVGIGAVLALSGVAIATRPQAATRARRR